MMENYVWLFPILFIFHDMEEIIGFGIWREKNRKLLKEKYPNIWKSVLLLQCSTGTLLLYSLIGIIVVAIYLKFVQSLIGRYTKWRNII
ncbi:MAG: HXXEE domain-containing protein [Lachnospiraceae bacterium]